MSAREDGGQAFPRTYIEIIEIANEKKDVAEWDRNGMTLQDYFAGQALTGAGVPPGPLDANAPLSADRADDVAQWCYTVANAMVRERGKAP